MTSYVSLGWEAGAVRVKSFATSSRGKVATIKIELETSDSYQFAAIVREIHEAQAATPVVTRRKTGDNSNA